MPDFVRKTGILDLKGIVLLKIFEDLIEPFV